MSEQNATAVQDAEIQVSQPPKKGKTPATHEQKQKRRKLIRRIIALVVAVAIIITSVVLLRKFVFKGENDGKGQAMSAVVTLGTIQSKVQGSGTARAKKAAAVTPEAGYTVLELLVKEGDQVEEGQLLYNLDDTAAQDALRNAQETVRTTQESVRKAQEGISDYDREVEKAEENLQNLTITAPHDGKLTEVKNIKVGDDLGTGTAVATLVNDTKLRLRLYYSWAYEGQIRVGQSVRITLPGLMSDYPGSVEQVNMVKRVVPEGSVTFEVVFVMDNPGTLTEGMVASASLTGANGEPAYPYESGKLEYYETTEITAKVGGPVEFVKLMNYADVRKGQTLVRLGNKEALAELSAKENNRREAMKSVETAQKSVDEARKAVEEAQKKLDNYHAVAPISGTVLSLGGLTTGAEVPSGAAIQIADTSTMIVDISIDERNIGYVSQGMFVDLQDEMDNYYMGTIDTVALSATAENGVATFPATVVVDNPEGMLRTNSYIRYSMVANQSSDCLVVPLQAVKNVSLPNGGDMGGMGVDPGMDGGFTIPQGGEDFMLPEEGDDGTLPEGGDAALPEGGGDVAEPAGDDMVIDDLPAARARSVVMVDSAFYGGFSSSLGPGAFETAGTATVCFVKGKPDERAIEADEAWDVPEGYFPVLVTTGLSDESNVEIISGLNLDEEVFIGYETDNAYAGW